MSHRIKSIAALAVIVLCATACSQSKGDFAFKGFQDDTFKRTAGAPEFPGNEEVRWIFLFKKKYNARDIGIVYLKKELVWVEVFTDTAKITLASNIVYGTIKSLQPGEYRIVLTDLINNNEEIARKEFSIYEKEEDE